MTCEPNHSVISSAHSELGHGTDGSADMNHALRGKRLTRIFVALGRLTVNQALEAEQRTLTSGISLTQYLRESNWLSPDDILTALSLQSGFPLIDLDSPQYLDVDPELLNRFKPLVLTTYQFLPYEVHDEVVCVAVDTPLKPVVIATLEARFGVKLLVSLAPQHQVQARLCRLAPQDHRRRSPRFDTALPLILRPEDDVTKELLATTVNISEGGVMFHTRTNLCAFNPGMHFTLAEPRHPLNGFGVIRQFSLDEQREGKRWIGRLEFLKNDELQG